MNAADQIAYNLMNNPVTGTFICCAFYVGFSLLFCGILDLIKFCINKYMELKNNEHRD